MASSRATTALAAVLVVALLATLAVGADVLPSPLGPDQIEATPEPFATTATTTTGPGTTTATDPTTPATATEPATPSTTGDSVADAPPPTGTPPTGTPPTAPTATEPRTQVTPTPAVETDATADGGTAFATRTTTGLAATATSGPTPANRRYERARVTIIDENGTQLATVRTWIADTKDKRYTGLSNTRSLRNGTGMLFVYSGESDRTYVMRDMDYPLDIAFIGADCRINEIASAPAPDPGQDGESIRRSGSARWVLEVPRGWLNATGVDEGDRIAIDRSS